MRTSRMMATVHLLQVCRNRWNCPDVSLFIVHICLGYRQQGGDGWVKRPGGSSCRHKYPSCQFHSDLWGLTKSRGQMTFTHSYQRKISVDRDIPVSHCSLPPGSPSRLSVCVRAGMCVLLSKTGIELDLRAEQHRWLHSTCLSLWECQCICCDEEELLYPTGCGGLTGCANFTCNKNEWVKSSWCDMFSVRLLKLLCSVWTQSFDADTIKAQIAVIVLNRMYLKDQNTEISVFKSEVDCLIC